MLLHITANKTTSKYFRMGRSGNLAHHFLVIMLTAFQRKSSPALRNRGYEMLEATPNTLRRCQMSPGAASFTAFGPM